MKIGEMIRLWRNIEGYGIRGAAADIGISAATLSRIEHGEKIDAQTQLKLINYLFTD
jgi:transcriptional regulator with XRE-family HTH domain